MSPDLTHVVDLWWSRLPVARMLALASAPIMVVLLLSGVRTLSNRFGLLSAAVDAQAERLPAELGPDKSWRWLRWSLVVASLALGYRLVLVRASLFDDAFISFRYARNLAEGHGLVFNLGERVEGYTNFLWTLLIGVLHRLTPFEAPAIGLFLCLFCFGLNLLAVAALGRELSRLRGEDVQQQTVVHLPLAVMLLAIHGVYATYGTSGLETGAASLFVNLGALFLLTRRDAVGATLTGSMFIVATLMRPDHGLFYAVGGLVVLVDRWPMLRAAREDRAARKDRSRRVWRAGGIDLVAYAAPFAVYGVYLLVKFSYYGDILPNTYYAKSVDLAWFDQGRLYAATFYLGTQDWLLVLLCFLWLAMPSADAAVRRYKLFTVASFVVYNVYVAKVGGDFMFGRFYVSLIPLYLLGVDALVHQAARSRRPTWVRWLAAGAVSGLALASSQDVELIPPKGVRWGIADEASFYPIKSFRPLVVDHAQERTGRFFGRVLEERGLEVVLATGGTGALGYYARLEVVDTQGLTDAVVARQPLTARGRPGHEKRAPRDYLLKRGVHLLRVHAGQETFHPRRWQPLTRVDLGPEVGPDAWQLVHYDRQLMRRIRAKAPEIHFVDFEHWLDRYIGDVLQQQPRSRIRGDLSWLRAYYFDHNDDPERLALIEARLQEGSPSASLFQL